MPIKTVINNTVHQSKRVFKHFLRYALKRKNAPENTIAPSYWSLLVNKKGHLSHGEIDLHELKSRYGSPLHVIHSERLADNARRFLTKPNGCERPCEVFYSYKTNPIPGALLFLHNLGIGAEVISHFELQSALRLGVPPSKIIYNGPAKSDESLEVAINREIRCINVNSQEELSRIADIAKKLNKQPNVGIRVSTMSGWSGQFGLPIHTGEALAAFRAGRDFDNLKLIGLHAHRGIHIRREEDIEPHVLEVLKFTDTLRNQLNIELQILNFGGSLACPSVQRISDIQKRFSSSLMIDIPAPNVTQCIPIETYIHCIMSLVEAHYGKRHLSSPAVLIEPGRAMTADAQMLLCSVLNTKSSKDGLTYGILDAGINIAECVSSEYHQLFCVNKILHPKDSVYRLAGPICTPGDVLYRSLSLPHLESGDTLAIMDAGAYFVPFETVFSFPRPAVVMIEDHQTALLRRRETFDEINSRNTV